MAQHRHKRETNARLSSFRPRAALVAAPLAVLATAPAVAVGVFNAAPALTEPRPSTTLVTQADIRDRAEFVSRSYSRGAAAAKQADAAATERESQEQTRRAQAAQTRRAVARADERLWTTTELNLWTGAGGDARQDGVIAAGKHVLVTGRREAGRVELVVDGESRWVTQGYLATEEPEPGIGGACTNGTTAAGGDANIQKVHQAVCARFPSISTYGTLRGGGGDHPLGRAVDIMVSGALGWEIANFVRANAGALGVTYVIYSQHIWSVERGGEGWRAMASRGSITANHYDHVHVSTY